MARTVPTQITDKNGKQTTVHKKIGDSGPSSERVGALNGTKPRYVAPKGKASLNKLVRYEGKVQSFGELLERLQPTGIRRVLMSGESKFTWIAEYGDDEGGVIIPAQAAKASGLKDVTEPIERVRDDLELAEQAMTKMLEHNWGTRINSPEERELRAKVNGLAAELQELKRAEVRDEISQMTNEEMIDIIANPKMRSGVSFYSNATIQVLLEQGEDEVDEFIARNATDSAGIGYREHFTRHRSPAVRKAYYENTKSEVVNVLFRASQEDSSPEVRAAAAEAITAKGYTAEMKSGVLVIDKIT